MNTRTCSVVTTPYLGHGLNGQHEDSYMLIVSLIVYFYLEFAIVSSLVGKYFNAIMLT